MSTANTPKHPNPTNVRTALTLRHRRVPGRARIPGSECEILHAAQSKTAERRRRRATGLRPDGHARRAASESTFGSTRAAICIGQTCRFPAVVRSCGRLERASLLTEIPIVTEEGEHAFLSITHLDAEEGDGGIQLIADGVVSYVDEDGRYLAETFSDVPVTLSRTPTEPLAAPAGVNAALLPGGSAQQRGPDESGVCDSLNLTLGPLQLDLLGLTIDLANVELDIDAVPGGGRLLGNLLCAVTGLLDPLGGLLQILQLLEQINDILDAINNLLSGLPAVGSVLSGDATTVLSTAKGAGKVENGEFAGTLTVTDISWDEAGETLLVDGVLNGRARVGRGMTQVKDVVIEDVPATLDDISSMAAPAAAAGLHMQRSPDENFVCDVLYLDLAPTFLDLLGLTVDLAEVELDVDAVPGNGRLLGNLLCAVTGLLDGVGGGGLGDLLGLLDGLLDAISDLLGGLSL